MDFPCGIPCCARTHLIKGHPHLYKFRHHVEGICHACVHTVDVQVCRDRVRKKLLPDGGHCLAERKASSSMTHVEDNPSLLGFEQVRQYSAVPIQHWNRGQIGVGVDVSRSKVLQNQF